MARKISRPIRASKDFREIINYVRARYIMAGKIPPTTAEITKKIAKMIRKEDLLEDEVIRF